MGNRSRSSKTKKKRRHSETSEEEEEDSLSLSSQSSDSEEDEIESTSSRHKHRRDKDKHRRESRDKDKRRKHRRRERKKKNSDTSSRRKGSKRRSKYSDSDSSDGSGSEYWSDQSVSEEETRDNPNEVVRNILDQFPGVAGDLQQLLQMIDDGQAVDIGGLSEKSLVKHLKKLFVSLKLKETGKLVFLRPSKVHPTLKVVGPMIHSRLQPGQSTSQNNEPLVSPDSESGGVRIDANASNLSEDAAGPIRRVIGPELPSAELLAAAAKLTDAEAELRYAELEEDTELFIGPPPPAVVKEVESANEAERLEEVTRIMGGDVDSPYDILGVNRNMSAENIKKRYWKLSLMVHPDKCPHPQAHQAFVKLNKAYKDLQDTDKRKALDEKIKQKEEQEEMKAELQAMREAAQWRRLQGISMEGDDILLADMETKAAPKRDEWMTTLPPERKPGMTTQSRSFSKSSKEGRGDTSVWTDTPSDRAQKAKQKYLEAYNEAAALASNEEVKKQGNADAEMVDQYNKAKRSKSLVEKNKESARSRSNKKSKQEREKEEWEGKHPWKPWDREKDLTAGRQSVKLDADNMAQGLSSRFSSGSFQRNFL